MRLSFCLALAHLLLLDAASDAGGIPAKTLKELKAASVYVKVQFGVPGGKPIPATGSGFVLRTEGDTAYIATNHHVVSPRAGENRLGKPTLVFNSGTPDEKSMEAEVLASDSSRDLAILKITGIKDLPRPIPLDPGVEIVETTPIFALGFPFGEELAAGKTNPGITITRGTISGLRYDASGQLGLIQIDAEVNPGNSGGPIVDGKGNLIGVAVSKVVKARTVGFAVPVQHLSDMMDGRITTVYFDTLKVEKGSAHVSVDAALIDPLGKLNDMVLHYRVFGDGKDLPKTDKEGKTPLLKGASSAPLTVEKGKAVGRFNLKGTGETGLYIVYQTSYVTAAGRKVNSAPGVVRIDFTQFVYPDKLTHEDAPAPEDRPRKLFTHEMKKGRTYVVEMRCDPKDLDPHLLIEDSKGRTLAEDDGAGGIFDALICFSPKADGEYRIAASAVKGVGPFTLRIREDKGVEVGARAFVAHDDLRPTDALDPVVRAPSLRFNVSLQKGKTYSIDMISKAFDPYLRLENMGFVNMKNEDIGGGGHSTLFFSPVQDGIYGVIATSYDFKTGRFDLSVREIAGPPKHEVGADGLKIADKLTAQDWLDVVNGKPSSFRCKVYEVTLKGGQKYQLDMTSTEFDPLLRIEDTRGKQLAVDDDSGGMLNARLVFMPKEDGVYRVVATPFTAKLGAFELMVKAVK